MPLRLISGEVGQAAPPLRVAPERQSAVSVAYYAPVDDFELSITTLEGLPALYAKQKGLAEAPARHPLQDAFVEVQSMHCGYCYNGIIVKASELLAKNASPTVPQIRTAMNGHLCRCGTYLRIREAIHRAAGTVTSSSAKAAAGGKE